MPNNLSVVVIPNETKGNISSERGLNLICKFNVNGYARHTMFKIRYADVDRAVGKLIKRQHALNRSSGS